MRDLAINIILWSVAIAFVISLLVGVWTWIDDNLL